MLPTLLGAASVVAAWRRVEPATPGALLAAFDDQGRKMRAVSAVVATKDSARTLAACLASLRAQVGCDVEIIVVDNSSTDGTASIAERLADIVISAGPERSTQRNLGVAAATRRIVAVLDSDMLLEPGVLAEAADEIARGAAAVVIPEQSFGEGFWARCKALEKTIAIREPAVEAARVFRKEVFDAVAGYDESLTACEDWDLADRVAAQFGVAARTHSYIWHDEGSLKLSGTYAKKRYYGRWVAAWARTAPTHRRRRSPSRMVAALISSPFVGTGLLVLKVVEAAGFFAGARDAVRATRR